jgi:hypothetical protein
MRQNSMRGYVSFLLLIPLSWLLLLPILYPPYIPDSFYMMPAIMHTGNSAISLKRALLVAERAAITQAQSDLVLEGTMIALRASLMCVGMPTKFPPPPPNAPPGSSTLPFLSLTPSDQKCYIAGKILDKWSSLLSDWNTHSDLKAAVLCDGTPLPPFSFSFLIPTASPAHVACSQKIRWDRDRAILLPGINVMLTSSNFPSLSTGGPMPSLEVMP